MSRRARRGRRRIPVLLTVAVLVVACAGLDDRIDDLRDGADALSDEARFCLALTRTLTAIEAGSPRPAAEAAEEAYAQAPADVRDEVAAVVAAIRDAPDDALDDPTVTTAAASLRDATRRTCDPTSG